MPTNLIHILVNVWYGHFELITFTVIELLQTCFVFYTTPVWNKNIPSSISNKMKVYATLCTEQTGDALERPVTVLPICVSLMTIQLWITLLFLIGYCSNSLSYPAFIKTHIYSGISLTSGVALVFCVQRAYLSIWRSFVSSSSFSSPSPILDSITSKQLHLKECICIICKDLSAQHRNRGANYKDVFPR